jgi:Uma2 family endonuclease
VAVVAGEPLDYIAAHPSTAALVVEVADSSLRLDRRFKAAIYARAGLREYWIVNLVDRALEVHREPQAPAGAAEDSSYRSIEVLRPPSHVTPLAAPHTSIPVADLLP